MSARTEVEFEKIAQQTVSAAGQVKCSRAEYVRGLEFIEEYVRDNLRAARDEMEGR